MWLIKLQPLLMMLFMFELFIEISYPISLPVLSMYGRVDVMFGIQLEWIHRNAENFYMFKKDE